jgi:hypothetical protein
MKPKHAGVAGLLMVLAITGLICGVDWARGEASSAMQDASRGGIGWAFDDQKAGTVPGNWKIAQTGARAKPAKWEVVADTTAPSAPNVVALTKTENTGTTFNLLMAETPPLKDLSVEAKVKVLSGRNNQGSGVFWRAVDPNNYYLARWTGLSNNFRVYCIKDAKPRRLANVNVRVDRKAWHKIEVSHQGDRIVASLDGKRLVDVKDTALPNAGRVGLVTKADASAAFDDVRVQEIAR